MTPATSAPAVEEQAPSTATSGSTLTPSGHLGQHPHYNHPQFQEAIRYSLERGLLYFIWDGAAIWVNGVRS